MAAAIDENISTTRRPELITKIDIEVNVNDAILLATEDGLLTALDDRYIDFFLLSRLFISFIFRTLRIWIKRQTGKYWPSVCYTLESNS
jgi:hypothetical protein